MFTKFFNFEDFQNFMYDFKKYGWALNTNDSNDSFCGFRYFSPCCFQMGHSLEKCLVAFDEKEDPQDIIAIIWFGEYGYSSKYQGLSYIDVREDWKRKGVATYLIKNFNNYIDHSRPICISQLSDQGQLCHLDEIFKKYLTTEVVFD